MGLFACVWHRTLPWPLQAPAEYVTARIGKPAGSATHQIFFLYPQRVWRRGSAFNLVAYWLCAVPAAIVLGFPLKLGVQGFYGGMVLGPYIQTICYLWLILGLRWGQEAQLARQRVAAAAADT